MENQQAHAGFSHKSRTQKLILAGLFATLTFVATTAFRIPLPAAVGAPFIHLGNSMAVLSVLFLGYRYGATAGAFGFMIFDVLNGYAAEAPLIVVEAYVVGAAVALTFKAFKQQDDKFYKVGVSVLAGIIVKILFNFLKGTVTLMLMGTAFTPAIIAALTSLTAVVVNAIGTLIIVSVLYYPLKKIIRRVL